ncbi:MAG TPA: bacillithiol biosynthesis deacetylase BshB1 [Candidatus Hydrogenedentes bacterium]|nr:bacillithiol biosynthesis deacetylase BshB1 [Candidatus Hydrogenedentota bacterium]HPG69828.1 bacillithiol biosynthesis deacetylase BshB1 [Candidatus Hydrogenedentota bacterium]
MNVDVLAVGAHPDDVELGIGGLVHKLATAGYAVGILDLTRGEMSTRGSVEERVIEARAAGVCLGVAVRTCAGLPDGALANTTEQQRAVIPFLRMGRPRILMAPMADDRHPDHNAAHALVRDANYFAGLARIETGHEPYRAPRLYYYHPYFEDHAIPQFVVDISDHFAAKIAALRAHASQFHNPAYQGMPTFISSETFWNAIETRAAYWGARIGVRYGEPLCADGPLGIELPPGLEDRV